MAWPGGLDARARTALQHGSEWDQRAGETAGAERITLRGDQLARSHQQLVVAQVHQQRSPRLLHTKTPVRVSVARCVCVPGGDGMRWAELATKVNRFMMIYEKPTRSNLLTNRR